MTIKQSEIGKIGGNVRTFTTTTLYPSVPFFWCEYPLYLSGHCVDLLWITCQCDYYYYYLASDSHYYAPRHFFVSPAMVYGNHL